VTDLDTGTDDLLATVDAGVATLTLNRPERRNALSVPMIRALRHVLATVRDDAAVRVLIVTGAGGSFCAGGDVKRMANEPAAPGDFEARVAMRRTNHREVALQLWSMPKPTIAALPGPAAGAGLGIALACDFRYASADAFLTTAFARVGLAGDFGVAWFLTRLVGPGHARELLLFSERVGAARALELGLVHGVFAPEQFRDGVAERARLLASGPPIAYASMKENVNRAVLSGLADCLDVEATLHTRSEFTDDHVTAARAFAERRPPTLLAPDLR
jgi:2-(1,2-epoxy-1,2-dihydrophenyl)acetyl-CoA isomerase